MMNTKLQQGFNAGKLEWMESRGRLWRDRAAIHPHNAECAAHQSRNLNALHAQTAMPHPQRITNSELTACPCARR